MKDCRYQTDCNHYNCSRACPFGSATNWCLSKAGIYSNVRSFDVDTSQSLFLKEIINYSKMYPITHVEVITPLDTPNVSAKIANAICSDYYGSVYNLKCCLLSLVDILKTSDRYSGQFSSDVETKLDEAERLILSYTLNVSLPEFSRILTQRIESSPDPSKRSLILVGPSFSLSALSEKQRSIFYIESHLIDQVMNSKDEKYIKKIPNEAVQKYLLGGKANE